MQPVEGPIQRLPSAAWQSSGSCAPLLALQGGSSASVFFSCKNKSPRTTCSSRSLCRERRNLSARLDLGVTSSTTSTDVLDVLFIYLIGLVTRSITILFFPLLRSKAHVSHGSPDRVQVNHKTTWSAGTQNHHISWHSCAVMPRPAPTPATSASLTVRVMVRNAIATAMLLFLKRNDFVWRSLMLTTSAV